MYKKIFIWCMIGLVGMLAGLYAHDFFPSTDQVTEVQKSTVERGIVKFELGGNTIGDFFNPDTGTATILVTDARNRQVATGTPYQILDIEKKIDEDVYFITTLKCGVSDRRCSGYEKILRVTFESDGPHVTTVISESGFGVYTGVERWLYIPDSDSPSGLTLKSLPTVQDYFPPDWNFGVQLTQRADWSPDYRLTNMQLLSSNHEVILDFTGMCLGFEPICARYLLNLVDESIIALPPPP